MITQDELLESARVFDLNHADVQRDYVFGWLISGLYRVSDLADRVVLKGGNALRKGYFPGTRFSDDLDFTSEQALDADHLLAELNKVCEYAGASTGVAFDIDRNRIAGEQVIDRDKRVFKVALYFKDFMAGSDHITLRVRMDLTEFDKLYLPVQRRQLIHPYSDADACSTEIQCIKLEEALADKLKCLLQRRYCYDLFDLVYGTFVSGDIDVDRSQIMQVFLQKTIFGGSPGAAKSLLLDLPLDLFRGYWGKVLCPAASRFTFDDAVEKLRAGIEDLFAPLDLRTHLQAAFYPSRFRNPILEAGSDRKLLRLTYNGATRVVEPYSLEFKRRKDGVAQEYLYVWDRTGGNSSGPGIKSMLHYGVQAIEVLDETFEPRYPVELSKAGDSSATGNFAAQRTAARRPRARSASRRRSVGSSGPVYIIQCSYCGKEFRRKTHTTRLNKHKDRYGNQCYGRTGFMVRYG